MCVCLVARVLLLLLLLVWLYTFLFSCLFCILLSLSFTLYQYNKSIHVSILSLFQIFSLTIFSIICYFELYMYVCVCFCGIFSNGYFNVVYTTTKKQWKKISIQKAHAVSIIINRHPQKKKKKKIFVRKKKENKKKEWNMWNLNFFLSFWMIIIKTKRKKKLSNTQAIIIVK